MPPATGTAGTRVVPARPAAAAAWPLRPGVVIAVAAVLGLGLRVFQLTRPGYLTGFTQYDDGVYIGNALRLVNGVIPYRDFAMVQPPGSMLLMVPAALVGKAFGSVPALAMARILTVGADTANIVLAGLLVRHRGPLAAGVASGGYAVYPAALNSSQSLFLEPWLNLFCLLGAVLLFDGDQITGLRGSGGQDRRTHGALWAGVCFGFAAAVKIWAAVPALVAWALCLTARRGRPLRPALPFAGGFVAGIAVPCLPFEILAPSGFGRTVFVSELVQATHGRVGANPRVADITGIIGLSSVGVNPRIWQGLTAAAVLFLLVVTAWLRARRAGCRATALDWFALVSTIVVAGMLFAPSEWYVHYATFAGPFLVVLVALSVARFFAAGKARRDRPGTSRPGTSRPGTSRPGTSRPGTSRPGRRSRRIRMAPVAAVFTALAIAAMGAADGYAVTKLYPATSLRGASALIPPGACVLTDTASVTIVTGRFTASSPGCPALVDAVGTLIATTDGKDFVTGPAVLQHDTQVWRQAFEQAQYVWLVGNNGYTGARIAWTPALHAYFVTHFRLIGLASSFLGLGDVPRAGLYVRTSPVPRG
jgi:Glycosyltransferase family 87